MPQIIPFPQSPYADDLEHPSVETLRKYRRGELTGNEQDDIDRHLLECEECVGFLLLDGRERDEPRPSQDGESGAEAIDFETESNRRRTWSEIRRLKAEEEVEEQRKIIRANESKYRRRQTTSWAAAVCLLLLPTSWGIQQHGTIDRLTQPQINATTLHPVPVRRQVAPGRIVSHVDTEFFTVVLNVPDRQATYRVEIFNSDRRSIWEDGGFIVQHGRISLGLSRRFLEEGEYKIHVSPEGSDAKSEFSLDLKYD